jgi:hypothetical protein
MTVTRDFRAPRNASFWGIDAVKITCDGAPWPEQPCEANRVPLRAPAAANVRAHARAQGWRVNVPGEVRADGRRRRLDFCPTHAGASRRPSNNDRAGGS